MKRLFTFLVLASSLFAEGEFIEKIFDSTWEQKFSVDELICEEKTDKHQLTIFRNELFGTIMALDQAVELSEDDAAAYYEMLVHVPLLSHPNPQKILIIGGGSGGALKEVLRHPTVEKVTLVEPDKKWMEASKKYLPSIAGSSFDDARVQVIHQNGPDFLQENRQKFDVILCDAPFFSKAFYKHVKKALSKQGIFVNSYGHPFLHKKRLQPLFKNRSAYFKSADFYVTLVPTRNGGFLTLGFATLGADYKNIPESTLASRLERLPGKMHYYNPEMHKASFALPQKLISD